MQKQLFFLLFGVSILLLHSCKKDSPDPEPVPVDPVVIPTPTGRFVASQTLEVDQPVMYSRYSVITDQQYIRDFLQRDTVIFPFSLPDAQPIDSGFIFGQRTQQFDMGIQVNFGTNDSVNITLTNMIFEPWPNPAVKRISAVNDSLFVLRDTGLSILHSHAQEVLTLRHKVERANSAEALSFYNYQFDTHGVGKFNLSLVYQDGKFYMPVMRYRFSVRGGQPVNPSRAISTNANSWILLNPRIQDYLGPRDTIIVQTKRAELIH